MKSRYGTGCSVEILVHVGRTTHVQGGAFAAVDSGGRSQVSFPRAAEP